MLNIKPKNMCQLFSKSDFSEYDKYADQVATELNQVLREHSNQDTVTVESIANLRKDIQNNPDLYLPTQLTSKLYFEHQADG